MTKNTLNTLFFRQSSYKLTTDYFERALLPYCEHYNVNEHPRNPLGVISVTFHHFHWLLWLASIFVETYHYFNLNARYRRLVNTIMLMNTLAILRVTFNNFGTLSLTSSACVNPHINLRLIKRALSPTCEQHYNVNEHPRNPSVYFR